MSYLLENASVGSKRTESQGLHSRSFYSSAVHGIFNILEVGDMS